MGKLDFEAFTAQFALENVDAVFQSTAISDDAGKAIVMVRDQSANAEGVVFHVPRVGYEDIYILNGRQMYFYSSKVRNIDGKRTPAKPLTNLWTDIPWNGIAGEGGVSFKNGKKPERLIRRCVQMASDPGDIVLDSFAGSGTTGAVAHKMGRRWIMVELGEHCHTHIMPRVKKVIDGIDTGGVTEATKWKGGGGFRYYRLAPSLLEKDKFGNWVVSKGYNAAMLAKAMCKLEGFTYAPSSDVYWQQGHSTEQDFIYVTTQTLTREMLAKLSDDVGEGRSLLICCGAFRSGKSEYPNLTLKKIPKAVMSRCEWGKDDYSLQIAALPKAMPPDDDLPQRPTLAPGEQRKQRKARVSEPSLFGGENGGAK